MGRILGLDIGTKTISLAISDPLGMIASNLKTIKRKDLNTDIQSVIDVINVYDVTLLVCGLPLNMNGDSGKQVSRVKNVAERIKDRSGINLVYEDERLTTVSAERCLIESKVRRENRKKYVDQIAASIILKSYLDRR